MVYKPCSQYSEIIDFTKLSTPDKEWELLESIGEGTYGEVFKARNLSSGQNAAVKVMESYNELVEEIEEEYKILKDLSRHSNLPDFYGIFLKKIDESEEEADQIWLVLELCSNGSVTDLVKLLIKKGLKLDESLIRHILRETLLAIDHLHRNNVIHRDIKGQNILITENGSIKLIDFGVSAHLKNSTDRCNTSVGTPFWMAPEVIACEQQMECDYDERCDIWSLGITAIELSDGEPPLSELHPMRALFKIPRNPSPSLKDPNEWSDSYNEFIKKCLVKDFEKRSTASELLAHPFIANSELSKTELESKLTRLVHEQRINISDLNKKPDVTTKHGKLKSKRKSKRYSPQTENDLATLENFDEESIVSQLFNRFMQGQIYTYIGDILLAVNPFTNLGICTEEWSKKYEKDLVEDNPPHIFAIAQKTYKSMMHNDTNQCIIISGESGSGKTESANFLLQQLTILGRAPTKCLEEKILQVNPLMEAFGNAKTVINNNSSRFGKYLDMIFTNNGQVIGAQLHEYLLEKSRVVSQATDERNFHIFYYMYDGLSNDTQNIEYHLSGDTEYKYLNDVDPSLKEQNRSKFSTINNCFETIGFKICEVNSIYSLLAGVLHLGNISFVQDEETHNDGKCYVFNKNSLVIISELLGVDEKEMENALTQCCIVTRGETVVRSNTMKECQAARDSMSKSLYGRLFSWIVNKINLLLQPVCFETEKTKTISLLDIFGFENFPRNSFEQLCINIANEQIQYYFNQHVFAWEMQEYMNEGIDGSNITFVDNRPVLDMFLAKPMGLLALLDEESRFPRANDSTLVEKFHRNIKASCYTKPKSNELIFTINHYAGNVQYDATGFLEKNSDYVPPEILSLLKKSEISLIRTLFRSHLAKTGNLIYGSLKTNYSSSESFESGSNSNFKYARSNKTIDTTFSRSQSTVSTYFRFSLMDLLSKMVAGAPHFVRCIRPNKHKIPGFFDSETVSNQLKYTGVLETTKIRRLGYSYRVVFSEFVKRYSKLAYPLSPLKTITKESCIDILQKLGLENWKMGKTKIFFKYYHVKQLGQLSDNLFNKVVVIQCAVRRWLAHKEFNRQKKIFNEAAVILQKYYRGFNVRKQTQEDQSIRSRAAIIIQSQIRGYLARKKYINQKGDKLQNERKRKFEQIENSVKTIQSYWRGWKIRKIYKEAILDRAAKSMQACYFSQQIELLGNEAYNSIIKTTYQIFPCQKNSLPSETTSNSNADMHNINCIHCISGQILVPVNTPIFVSSSCSPIDPNLTATNYERTNKLKKNTELKSFKTKQMTFESYEIEESFLCDIHSNGNASFVVNKKDQGDRKWNVLCNNAENKPRMNTQLNIKNGQKCIMNTNYYDSFANKNAIQNNQAFFFKKNQNLEKKQSNQTSKSTFNNNNSKSLNTIKIPPTFTVNDSRDNNYIKTKRKNSANVINSKEQMTAIQKTKLLFEQQQQQNQLSKIKSDRSFDAPKLVTISNDSKDESNTKNNFRAFLRKTGQDLTSGNTLSKIRNNEAKQIDFRNVLRKNHIQPPTKVEIEKMKLIQHLILTNVANG